MTHEPHAPRFEALIIPDDALAKGGVEILRAAIVGGQLHVTLRRTFEQPDPWGGLLSEVARRVARAYTADGTFEEREVIFRIHSSFAAEDKVRGGRARKTARRPAKKKSPKRRGRR
ncbi:MAG TPA: DUF5076 domain-containing protein [Xanthobacteraceae bacterium]|nr:DUF5076 domain-containing protein [Xanthobacteraceae bacterium]